jgi:hypothetical protein
VAYEFHRAILQPVHEELRQEFPTLITEDVEQIVAFKPRVLVLSCTHGSMFRKRLPETAIIWTRHGFANKKNIPRSIAGCDFACLSSEWVRSDFERRGLRPRLGVWITGFVPMDRVLYEPPQRRSEAPTMLFAPTWHPSLSAAPIVAEEAFEQICTELPELRVLIKPHPVTPDRNPEWMETWRRIAKRHPKVRLIEESHQNIYDLIGEADVLVSDVSSVIFYFLALDRPIVLVDVPQGQLDHSVVDPEAPEWTWRDVGLRVDSPTKLLSAVRRCLAYPEENADVRAEYRRRVFGEGLNNRASTLIAQKISLLLRPTLEEQNLAEITWNAIRTFGTYEGRVSEMEERARKGEEAFSRRITTLDNKLRDRQEAYNTLVDSLPLRLSRSIDRYPLVKRSLKAVMNKIAPTK